MSVYFQAITVFLFAVLRCPFSFLLFFMVLPLSCMALLLSADQRRWLEGGKGGRKKCEHKRVSMHPDSSLNKIKDASEPQHGRKGSNFQRKRAEPAGATADNAEPERYDWLQRLFILFELPLSFFLFLSSDGVSCSV